VRITKLVLLKPPFGGVAATPSYGYLPPSVRIIKDNRISIGRENRIIIAKDNRTTVENR